jgi:hypothetical protein
MKDSEAVLADIVADSEKSVYSIRNLVTMFALSLHKLREKLFYSNYAPH